MKGLYIVSDGIDFAGKGETNKAIVQLFRDNNYRIFDLHEFWEKHHTHPDFSKNAFSNELEVNLDSFDVLVSSEPTYVGTGLDVRTEITAINNREYSTLSTAYGYSLDREILLRRIVLPALSAGKHVLQERSVSTTLVYQPMQSNEQNENLLTIGDLMKLPGNALALENAPDLLLIPTINDEREIYNRSKNRVKQDNCKFEKMEFQLKIKPYYESERIKKIFTDRGTKVEYFDSSISVEHTWKEAQRIVKEFTHSKNYDLFSK